MVEKGDNVLKTMSTTFVTHQRPPCYSLKVVYYQILDRKTPELHRVNSFVLMEKISSKNSGEKPCPSGEPIRHTVLRVEYGLITKVPSRYMVVNVGVVHGVYRDPKKGLLI